MKMLHHHNIKSCLDVAQKAIAEKTMLKSSLELHFKKLRCQAKESRGELSFGRKIGDTLAGDQEIVKGRDVRYRV